MYNNNLTLLKNNYNIILKLSLMLLGAMLSTNVQALELPKKENVEANKTWTITFNKTLSNIN